MFQVVEAKATEGGATKEIFIATIPEHGWKSMSGYLSRRSAPDGKKEHWWRKVCEDPKNPKYLPL